MERLGSQSSLVQHGSQGHTGPLAGAEDHTLLGARGFGTLIFERVSPGVLLCADGKRVEYRRKWRRCPNIPWRFGRCGRVIDGVPAPYCLLSSL
jgi:hypothetical protein